MLTNSLIAVFQNIFQEITVGSKLIGLTLTVVCSSLTIKTLTEKGSRLTIKTPERRQ